MDVRERCNAIEDCYEFMLAYAAKGLPGDGGSGAGSQLRDHLGRGARALSGLADAYAAAAKNEDRQPIERYQAFLTLLDRDARNSLVAIELVLSLPSISSQVIDNLNALIHLRALLTDLFLIDEILRPQRMTADTMPTNSTGQD
jgi:hypothetical protein